MMKKIFNKFALSRFALDRKLRFLRQICDSDIVILLSQKKI